MRKETLFLKEFFQRFVKTIKIRFYLAILAFVLLGIGFILCRIPYPWLVALGISFLDFLPALGAGLAMVPWAGYHYLQGNSSLALQLLLLYLVVFIGLRLLEPVLLGKSTGLHPLLTFAISTLSILIFGLWGIIIGPVLVVVGGLVQEFRSYQKKLMGTTKIG